MTVIMFAALFLLSLCGAQETPVFKQRGTDLLLDVKDVVTLEDGDDLTWTVNGRTNIVKLTHDDIIKPVFFNGYKSRAEMFARNYSLLLKNIQLSDSGVYVARVNSVTDVAKYKLTVQDPVSPVNLTVKSCSSDRSNLTVVCRTLDSNISSTFTCRDQTCSHDGGVGTTPGASLDIYLQNGSVICNHSNRVSSEEDGIKIEDLCRRTPDPEQDDNETSAATVTHTVLAVVLPLIILLAGGIV